MIYVYRSAAKIANDTIPATFSNRTGVVKINLYCRLINSCVCKLLIKINRICLHAWYREWCANEAIGNGKYCISQNVGRHIYSLLQFYEFIRAKIAFPFCCRKAYYDEAITLRIANSNLGLLTYINFFCFKCNWLNEKLISFNVCLHRQILRCAFAVYISRVIII